MRRFFSARRSMANRFCGIPSEVQTLEPRALLAGVVNVAISKAGNVTITGDSKDNAVTVNVDADGVSIIGFDGTKIKFDGETSDAGEEVQLTDGDAEIPGKLTVNMKGGDDSLVLAVTAAASVDKGVSIDMGTGDDFAGLFVEGAALTVTGTLSIKTGSGSDEVFVTTGVDGSILVEGSTTIDTGAGSSTDNVLVGNDALIDELAALTEDSTVDDLPADTSGDPQSIVIEGSLTVKTQSGDDNVGLVGVTVEKNATLDTGLGDDVLAVVNVGVGGNLKLTYGDLNSLLNVTVGGKLTGDSGTGDDQFAVHNLTINGNVDLKLGSGNDKLAVGAFTVGEDVTSVKLNGGTGTDSLTPDDIDITPDPKSFENDNADLAEIFTNTLGAFFNAIDL